MTCDKAKVLFVINSLTGGGAERVMSTLLANSGAWTDRYEIALALLDDDPRAFSLPEWLRVFQLDCGGGTVASIRSVNRIVREYDPQVVLSFLTRSNFATSLAMLKRRRPCIISERTSTPAHLGGGVRRFATKMLMRAIYPRATKVVAVSAGVATKLIDRFGVSAKNMEVIPNPVDAAAIEAAAGENSPLDVREPYIIAVGRLVSVKNYPLLIEAFARSGLSCRLVIAGDGPERDKLKGLAEKLGVGPRVAMPGWLANPYPALRSSSAFALSSNVEGFPNALVEALALGVPCVATDCPHGPAEILGDGTTPAMSGATIAGAGILTPVGDVDSYAQALQLVLQSPLRERLVAAGKQRATRYSAAAITARYWAVIETALQGSQTPLAS
jgi:N-acetylgalactosamine-N,N'-diacetylbacillosaminyl-diphospho-undecaprenol 4-alpha-N-acetylgalactosaminyltransferase